MTKQVLITEPSGRVVSAANLRTHLRYLSTDEDTYLESLSDAAEDRAEDFLWRKLLEQTWDQYFDGFSSPLWLRWPPVSSITSVTYIDTNGDTQTLSTDIYELGEIDGINVVRLKADQVWPSTQLHADTVTVRTVLGYGAAADVPPRVIQAIQLHVGWFFRNREADPMSMPNAFETMLYTSRANTFQVK